MHALIYLVNADIDECTECFNAGCEQVCNNTFGGFYCDCGVGYKLAEDRFNCEGTNIQKYSLYTVDYYCNHSEYSNTAMHICSDKLCALFITNGKRYGYNSCIQSINQQSICSST